MGRLFRLGLGLGFARMVWVWLSLVDAFVRHQVPYIQYRARGIVLNPKPRRRQCKVLLSGNQPTLHP